MARQELHSESLPKVEQMPPINDQADYEGDVVLTERTHEAEYFAELDFMAEPVTIRLEPSAERNAPTSMPVWCNGRKAEVFQRGRWEEIGYLPIGQVITIRRCILEIIVRSKVDTVTTPDMDGSADRAEGNRLQRFTSPVASFSVIEDRNPKGPAWLGEMRRRNL